MDSCRVNSARLALLKRVQAAIAPGPLPHAQGLQQPAFHKSRERTAGAHVSARSGPPRAAGARLGVCSLCSAFAWNSVWEVFAKQVLGLQRSGRWRGGQSPYLPSSALPSAQDRSARGGGAG